MTTRTSAEAGEYLHGVGDYLEKANVYPYLHLLVKELVSRQPADPVQFLLDFIPKSTARLVVLGPGSEAFAKKIAENGVGVAKPGELETCDGTTLSSPESIKSSLQTKEKWVCYGYPRNASEALDIVDARVLVSLVIVLQERGADREATPEDHGMLQAIAQFPSSAVCTVDAGEDNYEENLVLITKKLQQQSIASQPRAAPQIILYGSRGSGVTTQGERLAKKRGLVLVDAHRLAGASGSKSSSHRQQLVEARLARPDAKEKGFVMCHYPTTPDEAASLKQYLKKSYAGEPKLLHLGASSWVCGRRLGGQMFRDAGSGRIIPPREATRNSSVSGPDTDMPAMIAYRDYLKQCAGMRFVFDDWYDVDASQTIDHAGEEIEEVLGL